MPNDGGRAFRQVLLLAFGAVVLFSDLWDVEFLRLFRWRSAVSFYWSLYVVLESLLLLIVLVVLHRNLGGLYKRPTVLGVALLTSFSLLFLSLGAVGVVVVGGCHDNSFSLPITISARLVGPVLEELVMAGLVQRPLFSLLAPLGLSKRWQNAATICVASLMFSAAHPGSVLERLGIGLGDLPFRIYVQVTSNVTDSTIGHLAWNWIAFGLQVATFYFFGVPFCN